MACGAYRGRKLDDEYAEFYFKALKYDTIAIICEITSVLSSANNLRSLATLRRDMHINESITETIRTIKEANARKDCIAERIQINSLNCEMRQIISFILMCLFCFTTF